MKQIIQFNFSINHWQHLYSLQQAISHNEQITGQTLDTHGQVLNQSFLQHHDTPINIHFQKTEQAPNYSKTSTGQAVLGMLDFTEGHLHCDIQIDQSVFEELRKNMLEYADIEGIHIVCTLGVIRDAGEWQESEALPVVQLDYAMKGDTQ